MSIAREVCKDTAESMLAYVKRKPREEDVSRLAREFKQTPAADVAISNAAINRSEVAFWEGQVAKFS